jgi:hypothetical protein
MVFQEPWKPRMAATELPRLADKNAMDRFACFLRHHALRAFFSEPLQTNCVKVLLPSTVGGDHLFEGETPFGVTGHHLAGTVVKAAGV